MVTRVGHNLQNNFKHVKELIRYAVVILERSPEYLECVCDDLFLLFTGWMYGTGHLVPVCTLCSNKKGFCI